MPSFRGSYRCVRIALSVAVADGFMPRKVLDVRKKCVMLTVTTIPREIGKNKDIYVTEMYQNVMSL